MTIITKNSSLGGKIPQISELLLGELAVNTYDGKIFTKISDGGIIPVESVIEIGGGTPSELEKINAGLTSGYRILGRDPANYGVIGQDAIDLSLSTVPSTVKGATGENSYAEGINTTAFGLGSHTEGNTTAALGDLSHAEGYNTTASGVSSHAEGKGGSAIGYYSHAEGRGTTASGKAAHSEGGYTTASGYNSHSEGYYTTASGSKSHAEGHKTTASGSRGHAEGHRSKALGDYSHAEGYYVKAEGSYSHAQGYRTVAGGWASFSTGRENVSSGDLSTAVGTNNLITTTGTFMGGRYSLASQYKFVISNITTNLDGSSLIIVTPYTGGLPVFRLTDLFSILDRRPGLGFAPLTAISISGNAIAVSEDIVNLYGSVIGDFMYSAPQDITITCHNLAYGIDNVILGTASACLGDNLIARNKGQFVSGRYNIGDARDTIHETGIGFSTSIRKNAFEIYTDGTLTAPESTPALTQARGLQTLVPISYLLSSEFGNSLPTSSVGLIAGQIWNNAGVLNIV